MNSTQQHRHKWVSVFVSVLFAISITVSGIVEASNQVLHISENNRLEANISKDVMNRLAVTNDRIVNVFGDEGTFVAETDEQTGQVFIKPALENGDKPLSITLITENGLTQDLSLKPDSKTATTVILSARLDNQTQTHTSECEQFLPTQTHPSESEQLIQIMKQAVLGKLPIADKKPLSRVTPKDYKFSFVKSYQSGNYLVTLWSLRNINKAKMTPAELEEKQFFVPGDLALYLENRFLNPKEKTHLYAIQRIS